MAYLTCKKCLELWAEYRVAASLAQDPDQPETARTRAAILDEIETHEAEAHAEVSAAASG
jgi:hypothetical protein